MKQLPSHLYKAYFFDLDGTVYLGDEPLPGAVSTVRALKDAGALVRYLSNNPTRTPREYAEKLTRFGIPTVDDDVITTIQTTIWWLKNNHPNAVVFPIAEAPLIDALTRAGFRISDDASQIDVVIASYDRAFTYAKLQIAFDALFVDKRAILIQTNPDRYCPFPGGRGEPDAGAITAAIEVSSGVKCTANMGKPSPSLLQAALDGTGISPSDCLMTGDRLATDIQMAIDAGMDAAVVFTGETQASDMGDGFAGVFRLGSLVDLMCE